MTQSPSDEPRCRNCGASAPGAYCPACGQDTRSGLPTFPQFAREATGRYVALDGRLWKTLVPLLFRPGFLTREYFAGRRRRYIGPARLFLVSSLLLFAVLRVMTNLSDWQVLQLDTVAEEARAPDAANARETGKAGGEDFNVDLGDLPDSMSAVKKRIDRFNRLPFEQKSEQVLAGTLRYGPYAMFALLPAFAGLLKLLYMGGARRRPLRPRLYGEHLVFAAHTHAFLSLAGAAFVAIPLAFVQPAIGTWIVVYLIWALRTVYGGSWFGLIARSAVMFIVYMVLFGLAIAALLFVAILLR